MKSVPHDRRGGLSIVEVLISLSISAMLLVAVAAAFSASSQVIQENDEFFRATQAARVSLNQMLTEIRRCSALTVDASGKRIDLITDDGEDRSYVYDDSAATVAGRRLLLVTNDITTDPDYTMAENVSMLTFSADTLTNDQGIQYVVRVTATIEVQVGNKQRPAGGIDRAQAGPHLLTAAETSIGRERGHRRKSGRHPAHPVAPAFAADTHPPPA